VNEQPANEIDLYGLLAEFERPEDLVHAARGVREQGYRCVEAFTPFAVEGLAEALGADRSRVPAIVLAGGVIGGIGAYFMQWFSAVVHYPINVGGRPLHSWPAFIPITFEMTVLGAALAAIVGLLVLCGLPRPYHAVFNVPEFALASNNRFFLAVEARDPRFDLHTTSEALERYRPKVITMVPF
jgi:hypothetical protein